MPNLTDVRLKVHNQIKVIDDHKRDVKGGKPRMFPITLTREEVMFLLNKIDNLEKGLKAK